MILWYLFRFLKSTKSSVDFSIKISAGNNFYFWKKTPEESLKCAFFLRAISTTCVRDLVTSPKISNKSVMITKRS